MFVTFRGGKSTLKIGSVLVLLMIVSIGCTKYASQDELANLEAARQAAMSSEKERDRIKGEIRKLEGEEKTWQDSLAAVEAEFEKIKSR